MDPVVVVGLDFGTTYSGFAFAHRNDPYDVHVLENWPCSDDAAGKTYCKTQTSLFYTRAGRSLDLKAWGWPALLEAVQGQGTAHAPAQPGFGEKNFSGPETFLEVLEDSVQPVTVFGAVSDWLRRFKRKSPNTLYQIQAQGSAHAGLEDSVQPVGEHFFVTRFKLWLAPGVGKPDWPHGLSAQRVISDYLKCMSDFILDHLKEKYGKHFKKQDVQWCVTVPAIWDEAAKQQMQICCEMAGMIKGKYCKDSSASPHSLQIVLEPEAASIYCQRQLHDISLQIGDEFMVVDIGGGTIDLVVHKKANHNLYQVHEAGNCGEIGGGTFVDNNFFRFLADKIGCFKSFTREDPKFLVKVQKWWTGKKCSFDGSSSSVGMGWDIPSRLASAWKAYDKSKGIFRPEDEYEELQISTQKFKELFDTEVEKTIQLIRQQMKLCPRIKCLLVVGGFSENAYMVSRIKAEFGHEIKNIIVPVNPGAAVLHGAVRFGFQSNLVLSRKSRKTYGIRAAHKFNDCHSMEHVFKGRKGVKYCDDIFKKYVQKNQSVLIDSCVEHNFSPIYDDQRQLRLALYSSDEECPVYTTDAGCVKECSYSLDISKGLHLGKARKVEVKMYFGRSTIEVSARRVNFGDPKPEKLYFVKFETA